MDVGVTKRRAGDQLNDGVREGEGEKGRAAVAEEEKEQ